MADPQSPQTRFDIDPFLGIFILIGVILGAAIAVIVSDSTDGAWTGILIGAGVGIVAQLAYGQWRKRQPSHR
jgi:multisubunit Na+/H+ antiporter MnhB subunit